jgi:drug/metabolite transporter (DMT)-like permease
MGAFITYKNMTTEANPMKGILFCMLSYFFISLIGIFEKSLTTSIAIPVILFFQHATGLLLTTVGFIKQNRPSLKPKQPLAYVIRISSGAGCYGALFFLIRYIPVSQAMLYQYSASLWIPFIMFIWLGVKMQRTLWSGIIIGFIGMILILKPDETMLNVVSSMGILCGILQGVSVVAIRKLANEPIPCVLFYNFLTITLLSGAFVLYDWVPVATPDLALLCGVGMATYLGQRLFAFAAHFAHPTTLAPICYTSILYSGILGWVFWNEMPDNLTLIGMGLVIAGCLLTLVINQGVKLRRYKAAFSGVPT